MYALSASDFHTTDDPSVLPIWQLPRYCFPSLRIQLPEILTFARNQLPSQYYLVA